ncbi:MAG: hypothetical protein IPL81_10410 [Flavobacteriales bacterium]|nr:hypothetical protein [Flavobacteriales bacterium]
MNVELDPKVEALFKEAQGREDVFRFRQVLRDVAAEVEAREETPVISIARNRTWTWLAVAASLALLVTIGVPFFRGPDMNALAVAYAETTRPLVRGEDDGNASSLSQSYEEARKAIIEGRTEQAIAALQATAPIAKCDSIRKQWLLGLAYLHEGHRADATQEIQAVANSGCQDKEAAKKLLKKL